MEKTVGKQSIRFEEAIHLISAASIAGKKEGEGPLGKLFDKISADPCFGMETWEKAESAMQRSAVETALEKAGMESKAVRFLFGGDLLGQLIATSFGAEELGIPFFGLYGACSTCGESLALAAMTVAAGFGDPVMAVTSSHFGGAEKQFRFPLEYGNQRPLSATWTVTGAGAFLLSKKGGRVRIPEVTIGKVVDYGVKDSLNMGACMAPAAADTIERNLEDLGREPEDYDRIITGDLGYVGKQILLDLLKGRGIDIKEQHMDCGIEIFDRESQDTHSGGSGCGCSAVTLAALILPKLTSGEETGAFRADRRPSLHRELQRGPERAGHRPWRGAGALLGGKNMDYLNAFWVGGLICALVQILLDRTKLMPGRVMVMLVCSGAVLGFLGIYEPFRDFAGAGAGVPLLGFGNTLYQGIRKAVDEDGFLGLFMGGFTASAVGISAALIFSYLASLIFQPKMKE